jgi:hypothetical protein
LEQAIERDEAGASMEDAVEASPQFAAPPRRGSSAIRLEIVVEPPDQCAYAFLRGGGARELASPEEVEIQRVAPV